MQSTYTHLYLCIIKFYRLMLPEDVLVICSHPVCYLILHACVTYISLKIMWCDFDKTHCNVQSVGLNLLYLCGVISVSFDALCLS